MACNPTFEMDHEYAKSGDGNVFQSSSLSASSTSSRRSDAPKPTSSSHENSDDKLVYSIRDQPPWYMCVLFGFQHYLTMIGGTVTLPSILAPLFCIAPDNPSRGYILSTLFFVSGIVTLLQTTFGIRLPIVQGGTFSFLVPTIAIVTTYFPACDWDAIGNMTMKEQEEEWQMRIREVQGAIAVSSIFQILVGLTGIIGLLVKFITPLAVAPTIALIGISLFNTASEKAATYWPISATTIVLVILFSQYLESIPVPFPAYSKVKGIYAIKFKLFGLMPVLLAMMISWLICAILTLTDALPEDSSARVDTAGDLIAKSPWIRIPYPFQWGLPTVSAAGVFGMLAGVLSSILESIGDYYACARLCGAPSPPRHAINRGIGIEGFGCLIAGVLGSGNGTTSYSENIGAIGITKVGSRRVIQYGGAIMIICGIVGKFSAVFVTIPEPVVGGIFCVMFSMITAVGLSSIQHVDLSSTRNLFCLGFPIFFGLALSKWMEDNPGAIQTGSDFVDQILIVLLQTSMFVGGFLGIILDNTIPGSAESRGLLKWRGQLSADRPVNDNLDVYDLPFGMNYIRRKKWTLYCPCCPTFRQTVH